MSIITTYWLLLLKGLGVTTASWLLAGTTSLALGTILGALSCRHLTFRKTASIIRCYTFIFKAVPAYVQILIAYFVLPALLHISVPGFTAATGALALCSAGYITEIIRSTLNSINKGQWEACFVLGYTRSQALCFIIMPQALFRAMPALIGELEQLLKSTSLLATIGVMELTRAGINIISRELNPLPVYLLIASIYVLFSALLTYAGSTIEQKATRYGYR